jgi:subtilisin family serine protease
VIAAIEKAVKLQSQYNVRVINLSLGRRIWESCTRDPLCQAVEAAWKHGIVVVVAAGNLGRNGYATILSPGNMMSGGARTTSPWTRNKSGQPKNGQPVKRSGRSSAQKKPGTASADRERLDETANFIV